MSSRANSKVNNNIFSSGIITKRDIINNFILKYNKETKKEESLDKDEFDLHFKEWKYKLRLGREVYISSADIPKILSKNDFLVIKPGDFVLLQTEEIIKLDNKTMGFISMRFDYKQKGLINVSGFHVDPNYHGNLIFSAYNAGPKDIVLRRNEEVFMIFFEGLQEPIEEDKKKKEKIKYTHIPSDMIEQIRGRSATLTDNSIRLRNLEIYFKVFIAIVIPIMIAILGWLFTRIQ